MERLNCITADAPSIAPDDFFMIYLAFRFMRGFPFSILWILVFILPFGKGWQNLLMTCLSTHFSLTLAMTGKRNDIPESI